MVGSQAYLENLVNTATPGKLVILLYERAIFHLKQALKCMEDNKNSLEKNQEMLSAFSKAENILFTLKDTLNFKKGGEIAQNLNKIYEILLDTLFSLSFNRNPEVLKRIIKILEDLKIAWQDAEKNIKSND